MGAVLEVSSQEPAGYKFTLFIAGRSPLSERAVNSVRYFCDHHLAGQYSLETVDVIEQPHSAEAHNILATPTLTLLYRGQIYRMVGDLSNLHLILEQIGPDL